jgi:hypothetical protein
MGFHLACEVVLGFALSLHQVDAFVALQDFELGGIVCPPLW